MLKCYFYIELFLIYQNKIASLCLFKISLANLIIFITLTIGYSPIFPMVNRGGIKFKNLTVIIT